MAGANHLPYGAGCKEAMIGGGMPSADKDARGLVQQTKRFLLV
jgi:hypothetical protein